MARRVPCHRSVIEVSGDDAGNPTRLLPAQPNATILCSPLAKGAEAGLRVPDQFVPPLHARAEQPRDDERRRRRRRFPELSRRRRDHREAACRAGSNPGWENSTARSTGWSSRDPSKPGGVQVEIAGRLNALLGETAYPNGVRGVWGKVVAEARFGRYSRTQAVEIIDLGLWRGFGAPNEVAELAA